MIHHTMPKTKIAVTVESALLQQVDDLVAQRKFRNRSQAVESALSNAVDRMARTRLARECAKLNPKEEKRLAEDSVAGALDGWPEY